MIRIQPWLFVLLLPVLFLGACWASARPVWRLLERGWIRAVKDSDRSYFPVLVYSAGSGYSVASLGQIPPDSALVTTDFDQAAINKDLNALIASSDDYKFFQVLDRTSDVTSVTLEMPTRRDRKLQGWYDVHDGQVRPRKVMLYGPGFAFFVIPLTVACGVATVLIFLKFVRPRGQERESART